MSDELVQLLAGLGLDEYIEVFKENEIDIDVARDLSDADLKEMGLLIGQRKKLLKAVSSLAEGSASNIPSMEYGSGSDRFGSAERRQVTVLFCDLVDSTGLSERVDPEDMQSVLLQYQDVVLAEIADYKGYTAHFLGDGILAYFGWPSAHEDQTANAIRAALTAAGTVQSIATPSGERLSARVGIATGLVVIGDVLGNRGPVLGAITGATPNLAARIQSVAQPGHVVIDEATKRLVGTQFRIKAIGSHKLKGISQPVQAWHVLEERDVEDRFAFRRPGSLAAIVGREKERAFLRRIWGQTELGKGRVVVLSGEAGIGKSRIAKELFDGVNGQLAARFRFFCSVDRMSSSLFPILSHLRRAARFEPDDTDAAKYDRLKALFGTDTASRKIGLDTVAEALEVRPADRQAESDLPPERKKEATLATLTSIIVETSKERPVLIVLEDAQWVDPTTLELFNRLVALVSDLPVLLVVTSRPEFEPTWLNQAQVTVRLLNRLSDSDGLKIIKSQTEGTSLPQDVVEEILSRSDGIPLFIEELTRSVLDDRALIEEDPVVPGGQGPSLSVPSSLQASLVSRLDRLGPAKTVAQIGAAIGRSFAYSLVRQIASGTGKRLDRALETLAETGLVQRHGTPPNSTYVFKHALIQEAAYQTLLKSRREKLHAKIASVVLESFPSLVATNPEILALHYARAHQPAAAVEYYYRASVRAVDNYAHVEATQNARQALQLLPTLPDSEERTDRELDLQVIFGQASFALFGYAANETMQAFSKARALMERKGDTKHAEAIVRGLVACLYNRARFNEACRLAEEYRRKILSQDEPDRESMFNAHRAAVGTYNAMGRFEEAERHGRTALKYLSKDTQTHALSSRLMSDHRLSANAQMAIALWHRGYCDEADELARTSLAGASKSLNVYTRYIVLVFAGAVLAVFRRDTDGLQNAAQQLVEIAANDRAPSFEAVGTAFLGGAHVRSGDPKRGRALLDKAIRQSDEQGQHYFGPIFQGFYAESYLVDRKPEKALEVCRNGLAVSADTGEQWMDSELHILMAQACRKLESGEKNIHSHIQDAISTAQSQGSVSMERRASRMLHEVQTS